MNRRGIAAACAGLLTLLTTACGSESDKASSDPTGAPETTTTSGDGPQVTLLDPGAEPRQEIRLEPVEGSTQRATMSMEMAMGMEVEGQQVPAQTLPVMSMGMSVHVDDVSDGSARATFTYDEIDVEGDSAAARQMEQALGSIVGLTGTFEFTDRGEYVDSEIDLPDDLDPAIAPTMTSIADQIRNMAVPFPEEAVGIGATWTVTTASKINGIDGENEYTYELVEITDEGYVLDVDFETSAEEQEMDLPGVPATVTALLKELAGSGEGRMLLDLTLLLPASSEMEMVSESHMSIDDGKTTSEMQQTLEMRVELRTE